MYRELKFNVHKNDARCATTFEFNVKNTNIGIVEIDEDVFEIDQNLIDEISTKCFNEVCSKLKYIHLTSWSIEGRSGGWFTLHSDINYSEIINTPNKRFWNDVHVIEQIVNKYISQYSQVY